MSDSRRETMELLQRQAEMVARQRNPPPVTAPGRLIVFNAPKDETIEAAANDVHQWTILIQPGAKTVARLVAGDSYDMKVSVDAARESAHFPLFRPFNAQLGFNDLPLVGLAMCVHGSRITVGLRRESGTSEFDYFVAIVPGQLGEYVLTRDTNGVTATFQLAPMAREWRFNLDGGVKPGDTIEALQPDATVQATFQAASLQPGVWYPVNLLASQYRYTNADGNPHRVTFQSRVVS